MKLRSKIAITATVAILSGFGVAAAAGHPNIFEPDNSTFPTTEIQPQSADLPSNSLSTANTTDISNADQTPATEPQTSSAVANNQPVSKPVKPQPKPVTIYSDQHSADTPCRLHDQNVYTNDCGSPAPQQQAATQPAEPTDQPNPAPADNSGTIVSNPNQP